MGLLTQIDVLPNPYVKKGSLAHGSVSVPREHSRSSFLVRNPLMIVGDGETTSVVRVVLR